MSLNDTIRHHENSEAYWATQAVRSLNRGRIYAATSYAADSAMERHLAYEHRDTQRITFDAFIEHYGVNR